MTNFIYRDAKTTQISCPLGGIGAGAIGLAGNGRLIDWEIFNRPNKGSVNSFSHFAVRAEADDKVLDARVLHGDLHPPYQGDLHAPHFQSFGWGPRREYLTGLPHFADVEFRGEYPLATLTFADARFPGAVTLRAFSPLIPLNDRDSSLPAAFFEYTLTNTTDQALNYTLVGVLRNLPGRRRLLRRKLHPRLELSASDALPLSGAGAFNDPGALIAGGDERLRVCRRQPHV